MNVSNRHAAVNNSGWASVHMNYSSRTHAVTPYPGACIWHEIILITLASAADDATSSAHQFHAADSVRSCDSCASFRRCRRSSAAPAHALTIAAAARRLCSSCSSCRTTARRVTSPEAASAHEFQAIQQRSLRRKCRAFKDRYDLDLLKSEGSPIFFLTVKYSLRLKVSTPLVA